jgi:hypothetical protein
VRRTSHSSRYLAAFVAAGLLPALLAATDWPVFHTDSVHPLGNNWGEFQDYGTGSYFHNGIDVFPRAQGDPVYAVAHGWVKGWGTTDADFHYRLAVSDSAATFTGRATGWLYAHIDRTRWHKSVGDEVNAGEIIGYLVPWPVAGFDHCHFARISDTGTTWNRFPSPTWWFIQNPLDIVVPNTDTVKPVFENARSGQRFAFCRNNVSTYLTANSLSGDVDIIAKVYDKTGFPTSSTLWDRLVPYALRYSVRGRYASVPDTLGLVFRYVLPPIGAPEVGVVFKDDATCNTRGDYNYRDYYFIVSNTDGDSVIEMADTSGKWRTATFPDDNYWVKVVALDIAGNSAAESMLVTTSNSNPIRDVACARFWLSAIGIDSGIPVTPACSIYNYSPASASYAVRLVIGPDYDSTVNVPSHPGQSYLEVPFPYWRPILRGPNAVTCTTKLSGDMKQDNDRQTADVFVRAHDVGCLGIAAPVGPVDSGIPVVPQAVIHNFGNVIENFDIRFWVDDGYDRVISRTVEPGADSLFSFPAWTPWRRGDNTVACSTRLSSDAGAANDRQTRTVLVLAHDVGVAGIVDLSDTVWPGSITPRAWVHNFGAAREADITVTLTVQGPSPHSSLVNLPEGLPVGKDTLIEFAPWDATPGSYTAACSTYLAGDQNPDNDTCKVEFEVGYPDVGVAHIIVPSDEHDTSEVLVPTIEVENFGNVTANFNAFFAIMDAEGIPVYIKTAPVADLAPGTNATVEFAVWDKPHAVGNYITSSMTLLAYDQEPGNDQQTGEFRVRLPPPPPSKYWHALADVSEGNRRRNVRDGACLTAANGAWGAGRGDEELPDARCPTPDAHAGGYLYAFKGNNTYEFYRYNIATNTWETKESLPAYNPDGRKRGVKKGSSLTLGPDHLLYATKGNNTLWFWQYEPATGAWQNKTAVPPGANEKRLKEGTDAVGLRLDGRDYIYLLKASGTDEFCRYDISADTWEARTSAPLGKSNKPYRKGSCIAYNSDANVIYALKGTYDEFYAYDIAANTWTTLESLPFYQPGGRKKKARDGADLAYVPGDMTRIRPGGHDPNPSFDSGSCPRSAHGSTVYALKGGNTNEFWQYRRADGHWYTLEDMPPGSKRVEGGGALAYAPGADALFAFRGNNTLEFWTYGPLAAYGSPLTANSNVMTNSSTLQLSNSLRIAPNPFTNAATIAYSLPRAGNVSLKLYDVTGKLIQTLASGYHPAGASSFILYPSSLSKGIYLLKLTIEGYSTTEKLILE